MMIKIKIKCPCETDAHACCACVSMHCDECHGHSKFQQGSYCSNCGRPLKAELQRNYVPRAEVERLEHLRAELSKEVADLQDALKCEKETNAHLCGEYMSAKTEVAREILDEIWATISANSEMGFSPTTILLAINNKIVALRNKYMEEVDGNG